MRRRVRVHRLSRRLADDEIVCTQIRNTPEVPFSLLLRLTGLRPRRLRASLGRLAKASVVTSYGGLFRPAERPYAHVGAHRAVSEDVRNSRGSAVKELHAVPACQKAPRGKWAALSASWARQHLGVAACTAPQCFGARSGSTEANDG
jgi:hypothetical protein